MTNKINIIKSKYLAGGMILSFLTASTLFTFSSCADDHFDISSDVTGTKTIWENIKENKDLSDYAYILEHVPYSQKEKGFTTQSYAEVLNSDQTFTIWAPENGSYDFEAYKKLIESGKEEDLKLVERELIRNNMTRYTHILNGIEKQKLVLFNGKRGTLDFANKTFEGQKILRSNIASSNGVLHVTQAPATFIPSLYEYLFKAPNSSEMQKFLKTYEKEEFDEYASTPGPTVNGEATWVDSVTYTYNEYCGNAITREDSNFVMILPTDNAWKQVYDKIGTYFNYKEKYTQDLHAKTENGSDTIIQGKATEFSKAEIDSLKNLQICHSILKGTIFNGNWQPRQVPITSLKELAQVDSLITVNNNKFKKPGTLNATNNLINTHECADFVSMFGGNEPIKCSNGYAYITDSWNFPKTLYAPTLEYKAAQVFDNLTKGEYGSDRLTATYVGENGEDSLVSYDYVWISSSTQFEATFQLREMLSSKYDIYIVTLHNNEYNKPTIFKTTLYYHNTKEKPVKETFVNKEQGNVGSFNEEIPSSKKNNDDTHMAQIDTVSMSPVKIKGESLTDTICIIKDFEIPYTYAGLENAFPTITLTSNVMSKDALYCKQIRLVSFILKPKRDE